MKKFDASCDTQDIMQMIDVVCDSWCTRHRRYGIFHAIDGGNICQRWVLRRST
jgi:hypothetical protein